MVARTAIIVSPSHQVYTDKVKEKDVLQALQKNTRQFRKLLKNIPRKKINYAYGEGKWTTKEVLQHVIDSERVFSFRALWFARKDPAPLPGFDETIWGIAAKAPRRKWNDLVEEFMTVRKATLLLFENLDEDDLLTTGEASGQTISVGGLGLLCAGHVQHHIQIIKERYLPEKPILVPKSKKKKPVKKKKPAKKRKTPTP